MKTMMHPHSSMIATTKIMNIIPNKACHTTKSMIPHSDGHYHDHDIYHHAPNDNDDNNNKNYVISDDDKEKSGNNNDRYDNRIPGHYCGTSEYGSNAPTIVDDHYEDRAHDRHGTSNHGGSNSPSHDNTPQPPTLLPPNAELTPPVS